jgi:hypothetical protein
MTTNHISEELDSSNLRVGMEGWALINWFPLNEEAAIQNISVPDFNLYLSFHLHKSTVI